MNRLHPNTLLNLHDFARFMKMSLFLVLVMVFGAFFTVFTDIMIEFWVDMLGEFLFIGFVLLLGFHILQTSRLSRAKNSSNDPKIVRSYQIMIGVLIFDVITLYLEYFFTFSRLEYPILALLFGTPSLVMTIWSYKVVLEFAESAFSSAEKARKGFQMYSICSYISIGIMILSIPVSGSTFAIIISLMNGIIGITAIVGQFKLANGFLDVFSDANAKESGEFSYKSFP